MIAVDLLFAMLLVTWGRMRAIREPHWRRKKKTNETRMEECPECGKQTPAHFPGCLHCGSDLYSLSWKANP